MAEDFDFDEDGYHVSVDGKDAVGINQAGDVRLIAPNAIGWGGAAGTHYLPDGDLVVCDVGAGSLVRISPTGAVSTILSGLSYPNGLEVDDEGFLYVAENSGARVRKVDPDTGDYWVIASGLTQPNGAVFGIDFQTLYIGSFGSGKIYAIDRTGPGHEDWVPWRIHAIAGEGGSPVANCAGKSLGDECYLVDDGLGACVDIAGTLSCELELDYAACAQANEEDPCTTTKYGAPMESLCMEDNTGTLFCPRSEEWRVDTCIDAGGGGWGGADCEYYGDDGSCKSSWEGIDICVLDDEDRLDRDACTGLNQGDACQVDEPRGAYEGTCEGGGRLACEPVGGSGGNGQIDGIAVDECGYVYATEWLSGRVWRMEPTGWGSELAVDAPSSWIPNLEWGRGVGGWEREFLYMADRDQGRVFEIQIHLEGSVPHPLVP